MALWIAIAAVVTSVVVLMASELSILWQITIWVISSLVCAFIWVKWVRSKPEEFEAESLVGQQGIFSPREQEDMGVLLLSKPVQGS
ncbi:hypothetical protein B738_08689 [Photorhabdus temperata subsp. temperata M1021]|nr:hypothetical protein B738_08689 [Photorhabdus temperata subsp. temperata M1021]